MEAVMMQQTAAAAAIPARRRCLAEAALAGNQWGALRVGMARPAKGALRARLCLLRAHVAGEQRETAAEKANGEDDTEAVRLFVGLPVDVVCDGHAVSRPRAIKTALRALKLLGVDGVELPVSWALVQPGAGDSFEWAGYLAVARMVRDAGLSLRVSLHTDGTDLPAWVADAVAEDPDVLFTDRSGNRREGCLSFAVDELPVLAGKSPLEAYEAFFRSFADAFKDFFGSTVTDVAISLGPDGELRYPSYPPGSDSVGGYTGAGEFQCYDKHMLARLKQHADSSGQPLWGLSGPHDAPRYDDASPESSGFFSGSCHTPYGSFFQSWYAGELLAHGDRVLAAASRVFGDKPVELSARVPFLYQRSRPAESTAGLYGGYGPVAEVFARHACTVIVSGVMDGYAAGPAAEEVLGQIKDACTAHGARFGCENATLAVAPDGAGSPGVWGGLLTGDRTRPCQFTYHRIGAEFFSPDHWPLFVQFARALEFPEEAHQDDLPAVGDGDRLTAPSGRDNVKQVQTA